MTIETCIQTCQNSNKIYAGLEGGTDCSCGNVLTHGAALVSDSDCSTKCVGDSSEKCGGSDHVNLYWNGKPPGPQPTMVYSVGDAISWEGGGCYSDLNTARALSVQVSVRGGAFNNTVGNCIEACVAGNYRAAGVEFAQECRCGNSLDHGTHSIDMSNCQLACSGDSTEICGGANAFMLYAVPSN
ncbi:WSC domain-containing protein [Lactarius quietus]|nr:WSC domain-containing protein [Lactarius quietus]